MMRFGNPVQSVMVIAAATAASFGRPVSADCDYTPSPAFIDPDYPYEAPKRQHGSHRGHGYAKQRREARKRRKRRQ